MCSPNKTVMLSFFAFSMLRATEFRVSTSSQITSALSRALPGDTLTMTNGIWSNVDIVFQGYGTAQAPLLLRAETYGGVIIKGGSNLRISGRHLVVDGLLFKNGYSPSGAVVEFRGPLGESDSCRLTNSAIRDYNPSDSSIDYKWVSLYGTHNRVDHCYFRGKNHLGTTLVVWVDSTKPNYHQIDHNYFAYRPVYPVNGAETIRVGTSEVSMFNSFTIVEYNYFEECNGEIETISNKSCGNTYRYNTFVSCQGTLTLRHGNRCVVEGNFFFGNHAPNSGGIRLIGEEHKVFNNYVEGTDGSSLKSAFTIMNGVPNSPLNRYFQSKRDTVVFNTFVNNKHTINIGGGKDSEVSLPPEDCVFANNLLYTTAGPIITLTDTPVNMTWQGNFVYGATVGMTLPSGNYATDAQLTRATDGLWRPGSFSPVIDASVGVFSFVHADMDGQDRSVPFDVGADEVSPLATTRRPLTPGDVGPPPQLLTAISKYETPSQPRQFDLKFHANFPNPFNPLTHFSFSTPRAGNVTLKVFSQNGSEVAVLCDIVAEGSKTYTSTFDGSRFASGIYYARLQFGGQQATRKIVLLK